MAQASALNPCSEHVSGWGPAMMSPAAGVGVGTAGQVPKSILLEGGGLMMVRPPLVFPHNGLPLTRPAPAPRGRLSLLPCLSAPNSTSCPTEESWWSGLVIVIAVCCASLVFLTVLVIICYKAIKR